MCLQKISDLDFEYAKFGYTAAEMRATQFRFELLMAPPLAGTLSG